MFMCECVCVYMCVHMGQNLIGLPRVWLWGEGEERDIDGLIIFGGDR